MLCFVLFGGFFVDFFLFVCFFGVFFFEKQIKYPSLGIKGVFYIDCFPEHSTFAPSSDTVSF